MSSSLAHALTLLDSKVRLLPVCLWFEAFFLQQNHAPRPTLYSAPAPEALDAFARRVCQRLGTDYTTPDVVDGFSAFIRVATEIQVKHLNRQHENTEAS